MKVLIVSPWFPYPPRFGAGMRVYQLARQLSVRHAVTLLSFARTGEQEAASELAEEFSVRIVERGQTSAGAKRVAQALSMASARPFTCRLVYSRKMQQSIDELCSTTKFDAIQLEESALCVYRFPRHPRLVLDEHNIEYEVFQRLCEGERSISRRAFNRVEQARYRHFEQSWWSRVDGCVVTSEREMSIVQSFAPQTPVAVVPNGVDLDYFRPSGVEVRPRTVVFNGTLAYRPNVDAAHHLIEEIWPLVVDRFPEARLTVVGDVTDADVRRLRRPGVEFAGLVPDIRPYLESAAVVVAPVRIGGGTRLKIVEGLSLGKAMVSTSLGCEGIAARDGEHLLIGDGPKAFASRIVELFDNPARGAALGRAGRGLVEREYSWDLAGMRLEALYQRVTAPARASATDAAFSSPRVPRGAQAP